MGEGEASPGQFDTGATNLIRQTESLPQTERSLPPPTVLTKIVEADAAAHPTEWSDKNQPLFGREGKVRLTWEDIGVEREDADHVKPTSTKSWIVNVYGSRWIPTEDGRLTLSSTILDRLPGLHETIIREVLKDENSRPAKLVTEASQTQVGEFSPDDINIWLRTINEGFSPILATAAKNSDGSTGFITHDYTDYHPAENLLHGRKMQDRVTKASGYELKRRETDVPPLQEDERDGVIVIDEFTCNTEFIDLLDYAMHGTGSTPKERMLRAWESIESQGLLKGQRVSREVQAKYGRSEHLDPEVTAFNIFMYERVVSNLENFNQWYESDGSRPATQEEKTTALKDALTDITRVAEKLLGTHDGTDLELPDSTQEQPIAA